jgi:phosphoglycolate phosphatase-like HAD superfamily hydrolase
MMARLFILLDLDGTIVQERNKLLFHDVHSNHRVLMTGVKENITRWKQQGHFIAVCSNNVTAAKIMEDVGLLSMVDFVVGNPSSTFKVEEYHECFQLYRNMYRRKVIRWKIRNNRVCFVDNDSENLEALLRMFPGLRCFPSIEALAEAII